MTSTSLTLGEHWDTFIKDEVASGRYASETDVVRAALRELEMRETKLAALRAHLAEGAAQAERGEFVEMASPEELLARVKARTRT